jgi:hypothetical protein
VRGVDTAPRNCRAAGVQDASFHTLRHTAGAWMVQAGVPLYEVHRILGHFTPAMTQRYAHLEPKHLRDAVSALDGAIRAVDTPMDTRQSDAVNGAAASTSATAATVTLAATSAS